MHQQKNESSAASKGQNAAEAAVGPQAATGTANNHANTEAATELDDAVGAARPREGAGSKGEAVQPVRRKEAELSKERC